MAKVKDAKDSTVTKFNWCLKNLGIKIDRIWKRNFIYHSFIFTEQPELWNNDIFEQFFWQVII